jgi:hypothetical protein
MALSTSLLLSIRYRSVFYSWLFQHYGLRNLIELFPLTWALPAIPLISSALKLCQVPYSRPGGEDLVQPLAIVFARLVIRRQVDCSCISIGALGKRAYTTSFLLCSLCRTVLYGTKQPQPALAYHAMRIIVHLQCQIVRD